jgi:hypothetical protein
MSWITRFGSKDIPPNRQSHDVGLPGIAQQAVDLPFGAYDPLGSGAGQVKVPYTIPVGTMLVHNTPADLQTALAAWRALCYTRATLYRTPDGGTANSQWITARLIAIDAPRDIENLRHLAITLRFEVTAPVWSGAAHTETITLDASPKSQDCDNDGNGIQRAVTITVTASGTPITAVIIENLETGHVTKIKYTGTIAVGQSLVIDCGAMTVRNNGTDDYANLTLESAHTIREWLRLMPGANTIRVTRTGGDNSSTCVLTYADGWV